MEENTRQYLNLVALKLYKQFMAGMDFERNEHRWVFDWNDNLTLEENLNNVAKEEKALVVFKNIGCIESGAKPNYFRDQQHEKWELFGKNDGGMWGDAWEKADPAQREYDYIRFVDSLDWNKFKAFCEENSINYISSEIHATLEINNQIPTIRVEGGVYRLKTLQDGLPLEIIEHALSHPGEIVTFDKLRQWTGRENAFKSQTNFKQLFRKNEFGANNVLQAFAKIGTKTFMLYGQAKLTQKEVSAIQMNSTS
ncbi:MAG: hypothetical protein WAR37_01410 [Candidatus Microsaccharimonas sp.]